MNQNSYPNEDFDRLQMGLDILARIESEATKLPESPPAPPVTHSPHSRPSLDELTRDFDPGTDGSLIIGVCEDGLPIVLDLAQSRPGSFLILGDPHSGKTRLISSILKAAVLLNPPRKVRFTGIYDQQGDLPGWMLQPHAYPGSQPGSHAARDLVLELAELVDKRKATDLPGPAILLIIEDLAVAVQEMDPELQFTLTWLIQYGPEARIWTFAGLDPANANMLPAGLLESFGKCILGRIHPGQPGSGHPDDSLSTNSGQMTNAPFSLSFRDEWLPFWIPD